VPNLPSTTLPIHQGFANANAAPKYFCQNAENTETLETAKYFSQNVKNFRSFPELAKSSDLKKGKLYFK
jgi:hypothetical protein